MRLSAWMKKNKVGDEDMSLLVGIDRVSINRIRRSVHQPSWKTMTLIAKITKNQVRPNDFMVEAAPKKR